MKGDLVATFASLVVVAAHSSMMVNAFVHSAIAFRSTNQFSSTLHSQQQQQLLQATTSSSSSSTGTENNEAKQQPQRKMWDFGRFVQQSSKFVNIPLISSPTPSGTTVVKPGDVVWQAPSSTVSGSSSSSKRKDSSSSSSLPLLFTFAPLDDVVMGGASASNFETFTGTWRGTVTDANNGGFIGIRSTPPASIRLDLSQCQGLEWKLRVRSAGDTSSSSSGSVNKRKRRFKVVLRDSTDFNGVCWTTSVDLDVPAANSYKQDPTVVNSVRVPFRKQVAALYAKTVPNQTFRPDNVVGLQLTYSKFEYDGALNPNFVLGDLDLEIMEIRAY